jgi:hypothetical protein
MFQPFSSPLHARLLRPALNADAEQSRLAGGE